LTKKVEIRDLKHSSEKVGRLYPVLMDRDGNVIDGKHRLAADESWPKIKLEHIRSEKEKLLARLIANVCRRAVSNSEKEDMLARLGRIYVLEGEVLGKLANRISQETGMSYRWVMKYLPDDLKSRPGLGGPAKVDGKKLYKCKVQDDVCQVARYATIDFEKLVSTTQRKPLVIKTYANANFVNLTLEKKVYQDIERFAERIGSTAETIIGNAVILMMEEIEKVITSVGNTREKND
jgi:hypothetical protein